MQVEQLIAFEAALAELSRLYPLARSLTPLRNAAETELLPTLADLGARLRKLRRQQQLDETAIGEVATEILAESLRWQEALEAVRESPAYRSAVRAREHNDQAALEELIPSILAGYRIRRPTPTLYFAFSASSGTRKPGTRPFLTTSECADRIATRMATGLGPDEDAGTWWESDLRAITCAADPAALDSPIALRKDGDRLALAAFATDEDPTLRLFVDRVEAPFSVALASTTDDEWWEAYESYTQFRDRLRQELEQRGYCVEVFQVE